MWDKVFLPGSKPDGTPILSVLAKRTYTVSPGGAEIADEQIPLCMEDTYADPESPLYSEVIAENDLIFYKPSTDVVVLGDACAPKGKKAYHLDCEAIVGPLAKTVRVYGNRQARIKAFGGVKIGDPEAFETVPLGYAGTYGGACRDKNGTIVTYFPNPIGKGFTIKGGIEESTEQVGVPNIEDPTSPVTEDNLVLGKFEEWQAAPKPASLGWTRRNFYPRYTYAGVLPEYLAVAKKNREIAAEKYPEAARLEIPKMDYRIYQGASEGLWGKQLAGDEHVSLTYLHPKHPKLEFDLPGDKPRMTFDIGEGAQELEPVVQTLVVDTRKLALTVLWRGSMEYGGIESFADMKKFVYTVEEVK